MYNCVYSCVDSGLFPVFTSAASDKKLVSESVPVTGEFIIASTHTFTHHHTTILSQLQQETPPDAKRRRKEAGHATARTVKKTTKTLVFFLLLFFFGICVCIECIPQPFLNHIRLQHPI